MTNKERLQKGMEALINSYEEEIDAIPLNEWHQVKFFFKLKDEEVYVEHPSLKLREPVANYVLVLNNKGFINDK